LGDNVSMSTSNQVRTRLEELLAPLGTLYPDGDFLDLMKTDDVGTSVQIKQTPTGIKLKVICEQKHVEGMHVRFTRGRITLTREHLNLKVRRHTVKVRKFKNRFGCQMVAWEPDQHVSERLMHMVRTFVAEVFARN
jgi:hypothetical protein